MISTKESMQVGTADDRWSWLYEISGAAAMLAGAVLLLGLIDLIAGWPSRGAIPTGLASFHENWLVVIFGLHAGVAGLQADCLKMVGALDLVILALIAITHLGLYAALLKTSRLWCVIALVQPFLGLFLFLATKSAGRSAVMGAGLVISAIMLRGNVFPKAIAGTGLLASALLLAGDLTACAIPPSSVMAAAFGLGYVFLTAWLFLVGARLVGLGIRAGKARA